MPKRIKKGLTKFRQIFFREKYRFDQGNSFLVFVNFSLLVITLVKLTNGNFNSVFYYIIFGLIGTWLLGYFLDKVVKIQEIQEEVLLERSPIWQEAFQYHNKHEQKLEKLTNKLESIEKRLSKSIENFEELT
jgi:uncharacterized membrane protein YraQ (UPF0718 family)